MITILCGEDDFSIHQALVEMKLKFDSLDSGNWIELKVPDVTSDQIIMSCSTISLFGEKRNVIVRGLIGLFDSSKIKLANWQNLLTLLRSLPDSVDLIFVDGTLKASNSFLKEIKDITSIKQFPVLKGSKLSECVNNKAKHLGLNFRPGDIQFFLKTAGTNLWVLSNELEKLSIYTIGRQVQQKDIVDLVSDQDDSVIFAIFDSIIKSDISRALNIVSKLIQSGGSSISVILTIHRQLRRVVIARDLLKSGVRQNQIGAILKLREYPLKKTLEQLAFFSENDVKRWYSALHEIDNKIKRTDLSSLQALDYFITQLCYKRIS